MRRVVITGMGVVSPVGATLQQFFDTLLAGKSGIRLIQNIDTSQLAIKIAAEIPDYQPRQHFSEKQLDLLDRFSQIAVVAARSALSDAGLEITEPDRDRLGVALGTAYGGCHTLDAGYHDIYAKQAVRVNPFTIPKLMHNAAASQVSMYIGAKGPAFSVTTACASSTHSIGQAFHHIKLGMADIMLAGGSDAPITYGVMRCWEAMRVLATGQGDPAGACRPFSVDREGLVIGEGAGVLVLEELERARRRGAAIYAEVAGYGATSDAGHITHPTTEGPARAMRMALMETGVPIDRVDYINAHGTATKINDVIETRAIKEVFGDRASQLAISSTKSMHGHVMGASGAIELIATVLALKRDVAPPTANYHAPDPECDLNYVPNQPQERPVHVALSNSFAFGGLNAVVAVKKFG
ncbi:MAG: beta-ketoacyl-ACP synthase II [Acidobacteria bacterium]|nr:beta-ketoacyl-ACP synthase II [Acidobacteriota bacterium]MBI3656383.1 beta-ketoacyl-ACP synthase II [Acidobacteriota bacterium]